VGDYRNLTLSAVITTPSPFVIAITLFSVVIAVPDTAIHETKVSRGNLLPMDHPIKSGDDGVGTIGTLSYISARHSPPSS